MKNTATWTSFSRVCGLLFCAAIAFSGSAHTAVLYATVDFLAGVQGGVVRLDTQAQTITPVLTDPGAPQAIAFLNPDTIVYLNRLGSDLNGAEVRTHRISTNQDEVVARPFGAGYDAFWGSLVLEPGGGSVIVANGLNAGMKRVHLGSPQPPHSELPISPGQVTAMTITTEGRLFAAWQLGLRLSEFDASRAGAGREINTFAFDPETVHSVSFDPFTNALWVPNTGAREFWKFDLDLNLLQAFPIDLGGQIVGSLVTDGAGLLYYEVADEVWSFDSRTGAQARLMLVPHLAKIMPLAGVGGSVQAPEPGTLAVLGLGLACVAAARRGRL